jgi:hypothetical protein
MLTVLVPALVVVSAPSVLLVHRPLVLSMCLDLLGVMPVPIVSRRHPYEGHRDPMRLHPREAGLGGARSIPPISTTTPVPTAAEEDLFVEVLDNLNAGLHHDERRRGRQADVDMNAHLSLGGKGGEAQHHGTRSDCRRSHGVRAVLFAESLA